MGTPMRIRFMIDAIGLALSDSSHRTASTGQWEGDAGSEACPRPRHSPWNVPWVGQGDGVPSQPRRPPWKCCEDGLGGDCGREMVSQDDGHDPMLERDEGAR